MTHVRRFDHVGITVADLESVTACFVGLALEVGDLDAAIGAVVADRYALIGGIGEYDNSVRMAYVRGPEGSSCPCSSSSADARGPRAWAPHVSRVSRPAGT
jgi:hypothetical protein